MKSKGKFTKKQFWQPRSCPHCDIFLKSKATYHRHINNVHGKLKTDHKCLVCDDSFKTLQEKRIHVASVHGAKKPFKCERCHTSFATKRNKQKHIAAVHEGKKPWKCEFCDYR